MDIRNWNCRTSANPDNQFRAVPKKYKRLIDTLTFVTVMVFAYLLMTFLLTGNA